MEKYAHKLEILMPSGVWVAVDASQLTDDHEEEINVDIDPEIINGSFWYLDGNYTIMPMEVRIKPTYHSN